MNINMRHIHVALATLALTAATIAGTHAQAGKHSLVVTNIAGYYVATGKAATVKTLAIKVESAYHNNGLPQADITGRYGASPIVGQGVIPGDEDRTSNFVEVDFMYMEPQQGNTTVRYCRTVHDASGRVIAILVSANEDNSKPVKYGRISHQEYSRIYAQNH